MRVRPLQRRPVGRKAHVRMPVLGAVAGLDGAVFQYRFQLALLLLARLVRLDQRVATLAVPDLRIRHPVVDETAGVLRPELHFAVGAQVLQTAHEVRALVVLRVAERMVVLAAVDAGAVTWQLEGGVAPLEAGALRAVEANETGGALGGQLHNAFELLLRVAAPKMRFGGATVRRVLILHLAGAVEFAFHLQVGGLALQRRWLRVRVHHVLVFRFGRGVAAEGTVVVGAPAEIISRPDGVSSRMPDELFAGWQVAFAR